VNFPYPRLWFEVADNPVSLNKGEYTMTRKQPVALTEQELKQVSGGASVNIFGDRGQLAEKVTGSALQGNPGSQFGGNGATNVNTHLENKT
jgi:hypothetical protein